MTGISDRLPFLTADLPGCGGCIKSTLDDFMVEELPRYSACGEGTHVYITIEKRGLTTLEAVKRIARALGRQPADMGYAGMKDAQGVTRQRLSIEHVDPQQMENVSVDGVRVLAVERHTNKLRIGHLAGNRFDIRVRECVAGAADRASAIVEVLSRRGAPNYFGPQRFGRRGRNAEVGRAVLAGDYAGAFGWLLGRPREDDEPTEREARELYDAGAVSRSAGGWPQNCRDEARVCCRLANGGTPDAALWRSLDRRLRMLLYSAAQAEAFNRVLAQRISTLDQLLDGDVAWKHANGACFSVADAATGQARCAAFEISPTGPIPGARMTAPAGVPGELEERTCAELGLQHIARRTPDGIRLDGARRPLRVPLGECRVACGEDERGAFLQLGFSLPAGAYATSVVREITKAV